MDGNSHLTYLNGAVWNVLKIPTIVTFSCFPNYFMVFISVILWFVLMPLVSAKVVT